tara:strand:+ start:581 stop:1438 length:858 start_codon:yes stop_codon:yes gene_type:complete
MSGIFSAIGAAFTWALACSIWQSKTINLSSVQINTIKNIIALVIFFPILFSFNWNNYRLEIIILFTSGAIGIALGDSLYIGALKRIGNRRTLTIEALSPILANIIGAILIKEFPPFKAWLGSTIVGLSIFGIANQKKDFGIIDKENKEGFVLAFCSVLCAVFAATISRFILTSSDLTALQSTEIRLLGASIFLIPVIRVDLGILINKMFNKNGYLILISTVLGTNLGIYLQQIVFQKLPLGIGWTLLSTSPIFAILLSKVSGEYVSNLSVLYSLLAITGVAIAMF